MHNMRWRNALRMSAWLVLAAVISGCGDSTSEPETSVTINDLVGSWIATSAVFTNKTNSAQTFDIVASGGELRVTVLQSGGARTWLTIGSFEDEWDSSLKIVGTQLTSTPAEATRPTRHYTVAMSAGELTLTSGDANFDFTLSGAAGVAANEVVTFVRN